MIDRESAHEFGVVTRSRDIGDSHDYPGVIRGKWTEQSGYRTAYVKYSVLPFVFPRLWKRFKPDTLYLTSVHDLWFTWFPLALCRLKVLRPTSIVVSPTGEFSAAALSHHRVRKRLTRAVMRGLFRQRMCWHVASQGESEQLMSWWKGALPASHRIFVQPDVGLAPSSVASVGSARIPPTIVFASRIHPIKGLIEAVEMLGLVKLPCTFLVYGSIEDVNYWQEVQARAALLPPHIRFQYGGGFSPDQLPQFLGEADLFVLLTRGEGFGHVITEAMAVGCPLLISTKSMWTELVNEVGGLASDCRDEQVQFIECLLAEEPASGLARRTRVLNGYAEWYRAALNTRGPFQIT